MNSEKKLRIISKKITFDIKESHSPQSMEINNLINRLKIKLEKTKVGVALSAIQLNVPLRLFIVSKNIFNTQYIENELIKIFINDKRIYKNIFFNDLIFINPEIIYLSKKKELMNESCISLKNICGKVKRSTRVRLISQNKYGKYFTVEATGLLAQIFQHEMDHLNGRLFTDMTESYKCGISADLKKDFYINIRYKY